MNIKLFSKINFSGNGAPDIFGAMAAFTSATADSSALAIGALLGAGAFIRLVVAGACIWVQPLKLPEIPVLRELSTFHS